MWIDFGGCSLECTRAWKELIPRGHLMLASKRTTFLVELPCALPQFCPKSGKEMGAAWACLVESRLAGLRVQPMCCQQGHHDSSRVKVSDESREGRRVPTRNQGADDLHQEPPGLGPCLLICSYYFKADNGVSFLLLQDI